MRTIFKDTAQAWEIADIIESMAMSTHEEQLHYDLTTDGDTLILDIRKGDFDRSLLDDEIIERTEE